MTYPSTEVTQLRSPRFTVTGAAATAGSATQAKAARAALRIVETPTTVAMTH